MTPRRIPNRKQNPYNKQETRVLMRKWMLMMEIQNRKTKKAYINNKSMYSYRRDTLTLGKNFFGSSSTE